MSSLPPQRSLPACPHRAFVSRCLAGISGLRFLLCLSVLVSGSLALALAKTGVEGLPSTRLYPLEDIGCTVSGLQLLHDAHGRIAVAQQDEVFVLNDSLWQKRSSPSAVRAGFHRVVCSPSGEMYYGSFGAWGLLQGGDHGDLSPVSLVPTDAPEWTRSCDFRDLRFTDTGVLFWGQDGVVFYEHATGAHRYFPIGRVAGVFPLKGRLIVSTFQAASFSLDLSTGTWAPISVGLDGRAPVFASAGDGRSSLLLGTMEGILLALHEGQLVIITSGGMDRFRGPLSAMVALPEGGFAAAVAGYGVLLISAEGEVLRVLDASEFRGVVALEATERGVLWAATERGVLKIQHHPSFTAYGADQGLMLSWPQIVQWRGRTLIASGGKVFEAYSKEGQGGTRFRLLEGQPQGLAWGIAALGDTLLFGDGGGVYELNSVGPPTRILSGINVARLVAIDANTCVVIASDTIATIRREAGGWVECAARIPGVGYPYVVHAGKGTAWIELGLNRVARLALAEDQLRLRLFESFVWSERSWVNVSIIDTTVIFSASGRSPMYLDDRTLEAIEVPALQSLVSRTPYTLQRFARDEAGVLWLSHSRGLFPAYWKQERYEPDFNACSGINEAVPLLQCPPGGEIWASTDKSLYRLASGQGSSQPSRIRPILVGLKDTRSGGSLSAAGANTGELGRLRYAQNSLQLDFFAGTYAWGRPFFYEYRLGSGAWERASAASSVFLADLPEGAHSVEVRAVDTLGPVGEPSRFRLVVEAPWYRTWLAYAAYALVSYWIVYLAMRYSAHRQRLRLAELERLVTSRTHELRTAMDCLREEAISSATLAERNRLAGEIHDSLEQGIAGVLIQLEATSRLPFCSEPVRSGVQGALGMVQYCRDELRNAVRGLHSPVLDNESLETALRRIAGRIAPLADFVTVKLEGEPHRLSPAVEHHLLRIAQEALGNVLKHARATKVELLLSFTAQDLRLSIRDDGCGFDPALRAAPDGSHRGLPSFSNRAAKIGGLVEIDSAPGQGTRILVIVPRRSSEEQTL